MTFYGNTMKRNILPYRLLRYLHFSENKNGPDKTNKNYETWKMRTFDKLNDAFAKYYSSSEHLAFDDTVFSKVGSASNSIYQRNTNGLA
jgi:hypothetical protein